jgi:hypothetical protein
MYAGGNHNLASELKSRDQENWSQEQSDRKVYPALRSSIGLHNCGRHNNISVV